MEQGTINDHPYHIPALLPQALEALDVKPQGSYVDVTYGGGGHSRAIMERLEADQGGILYAFDQDQDAIDRAPSDPRLHMVHANFRFITNFMAFYHVAGVDGILGDLGVSFHHFDDPERGFSFRQDAPLDMRMNRNARLTAAQLIEHATIDDLTAWFKTYGELKEGYRMARAIIMAREQGKDLSTVGALLSVIQPLVDPRKEKKELACVFQALRIVVNDEMGALKAMLSGALKVLKPGGRLAIITYHSLEDRMVKNFMRTGNVEGRVTTDVYGRTNAPIAPVKGYPVSPDNDEIEANPRCRSARLRVATKL